MNADIFLSDCDCAIVTSPAALYYLSGFDQSDATILITRNGKFYLTNSLYEVAAKTAVNRDLTIKILSRAELAEFIRKEIAPARKVGIECDHVTLALFRKIFGSEAKEISDISPVVAKMRLVKRVDELAAIKRAEEIVDQTFSEILPLLRPGVTEIEIKNAILTKMLSHGAEGVAFDTIVAFGENAAMPHAVSSDRTLHMGDCVLMDFGAKYKGYCSDFTRTVFCGTPSDRAMNAYQTVLAAQKVAICYLEQGGRSAKEADRVAREVVDGSPFKGLFTHTLGHGVGIEIHESPTLSSHSEDTLSEGMVFTVEPGIYMEGEFGIRIESLVTIQQGKLTVIDRSDKEIIIV